jgi:KDO2-lipid IV(A) lauroyltransferase
MLPLPLLHALGGLAGDLLWLTRSRPRRIAELHMTKLFPDAPPSVRRRIARQSLREFGKCVFESPAIWFGPERRLLRWLDAPAAAQQLQRLAGTGGAIILCPHIGSWELAGMFCARHGGITSLYKPQKGALDTLIKQGRERLGAQLVSSDNGGVRALLSALQKGRRIGVLPDQDPPPGAGDFAPLFKQPAHTPTLVTRLAARTGVPVLFCYAERLRRGAGFRFHLVPAPSRVGEDLAALNQGVEKIIIHLPGQYWWAYPRFRRRPGGAERFY